MRWFDISYNSKPIKYSILYFSWLESLKRNQYFISISSVYRPNLIHPQITFFSTSSRGSMVQRSSPCFQGFANSETHLVCYVSVADIDHLLHFEDLIQNVNDAYLGVGKMWAVREIYSCVVQKLITGLRLNMDPLRPILCKFHLKLFSPLSITN